MECYHLFPHLMTNGSGGGSDANSFEIVDSTNITPNSISYDVHSLMDRLYHLHLTVKNFENKKIIICNLIFFYCIEEQQATATKPKKSKKTLKKKTKTSTSTTIAPACERGRMTLELMLLILFFSKHCFYDTRTFVIFFLH